MECFRRLHEIDRKINKIIRGFWLIIAVGNLLVTVNAVVVQHVQQQLLTAHQTPNICQSNYTKYYFFFFKMFDLKPKSFNTNLM